MVFMAKSLVLVKIAVVMTNSLHRPISHIGSFSADKHNKQTVGDLNRGYKIIHHRGNGRQSHT